MMAYEGTESARDKFIHQFQRERKLERTLIKLYRLKVY